jgi:hypothetical protein
MIAITVTGIGITAIAIEMTVTIISTATTTSEAEAVRIAGARFPLGIYRRPGHVVCGSKTVHLVINLHPETVANCATIFPGVRASSRVAKT